MRIIETAHLAKKATGIFSLLCIVLLTSGCNAMSGFLFYPHTQYYQQPEDLGLKAERIDLGSGNETLKCWLLKPETPPLATVLHLHGNGENISTHINSIAWLVEKRFQVFMLDYRGYGASTGSSTLASAFEDVASAHRWISEHSDLPLVIIGQSMGGAFAITYAASASSELQSIEAVIAESAPASWPQIAREAMRSHWLTYVLQLPASFIPSRYDAEKHVHQIPLDKIMLLHSRQDQIVPFHHSEQIAASANQGLEIIETRGPHIYGFSDPDIRKTVQGFILKHTSN